MVMPKIVYKLFNGSHLEEKQDIVFIFQTVTIDGYPHTAMLSVGEIVAIDMEHLRFALWPNTTTVQGLRLNGKANIVFVYDQQVYYIELSVREYQSQYEGNDDRLKFEGEIRNIKIDSAKYADITSGISIQLRNPKDTVLRWRATVTELLHD
ncbi:hypothetical protein [Staphylococcus gallinarum]|nr:hypothetical protein [Staphylococcus gallinarum]MCD8792341.1 pyridoxamine 5'-phosphate oxidase family protein [Staphylococcus gallinarum]MCD8829502.1 pyridoxamine 5'-phosphate oxidase family protein [Staphylococcus gallinarum]MCD8844621.1 pyridoxamine 5'-phosphate oxidase family protein [Staphylococcus gallinarum]MEB6055450.1 pyridoxamine 5'-phosphate oxidase family protein [Staphylococcus gallinarum]MEB6237391.1 pyridoxamine 5'-phosphate oxidase family protein [Staphylococcus gallinarum]